jgi:hypothetical protein
MYQRASRILVRSFPFIPSFQQYNVTICHEKKFIWFRVAKVGTRTMFDLFDKANLTLDAEHAMWCHYPVNRYHDYFKFALVRNPWDRLVSCWHDKVVQYNYFKFPEETRLQMLDFHSFVDYVSSIGVHDCDQHVRLQSKLIDLTNVDYIGRFETLATDLARLLQVIGLDGIEIEQRNASKNRKGYRSYYDTALRERVGALYQRDVDIFSYDF